MSKLPNCPVWGITGHVYRPYGGPGTAPLCKCGSPAPVSYQPDLFESLRAKDEGVREAVEGADEDWKGSFRRVVELLADEGRPFTSETAVDVVGLPSGEIGTNLNNAVGGMMSGMATRKIIFKTGRRVPSTRPRSHGAELTEWTGREETR